MRWANPFTISLVWLAFTFLPAHATEPKRCIDLHASHARVTLSGELTVWISPLFPEDNNKNQAKSREPALILHLRKPICANDQMFIDGSTNFYTVHVRTDLHRIHNILDASVGRHVTVSGEAFGSYLDYHMASLVLYADNVEVH